LLHDEYGRCSVMSCEVTWLTYHTHFWSIVSAL